jgi:hypothetical protein
MAQYLTGKEVGERSYKEFLAKTNDVADPSPWFALFLDRSLPMDTHAKAAFLTDSSSRSRQFLLPLIRPFCRFMIMFNQVLKCLVPNAFHSSRALHYLIYLGQKYFVTPEANYIIMRHFHIGSQLLKFLTLNIKGAEITLKPIRPYELKEIYEKEIYVNHDLNLFNFVIQLNESLKKNRTDIETHETVDFSAIEQGDFDIKGLRDGWTNFLDVESAIEIYTPLFQFFLRDSDFWRAYHSLQFDETIALYIAKVLQNPNHLALLNNKHPLAPMTGVRAAYRLVLHGISSELLHGVLAQDKRVLANEGKNRATTFTRETIP